MAESVFNVVMLELLQLVLLSDVNPLIVAVQVPDLVLQMRPQQRYLQRRQRVHFVRITARVRQIVLIRNSVHPAHSLVQEKTNRLVGLQ
mgnify:CR=1 FL=1